MKKLTSVILAVSLFSNVALAECDFRTGIKPNGDGSFTYSGACHRKVGEIKQDLEIANSQVSDYKRAIELKDLAIIKADQRAQMWMDTSFKLEEKMSKIDDLRSKNNLLYFGLGVVVTGFAVWGAGQLVKR
jgi:hypothetical protein